MDSGEEGEKARRVGETERERLSDRYESQRCNLFLD